MESTTTERSGIEPELTSGRATVQLERILETDGWVVLPDAIPTNLVDAIVGELDRSLAVRDEVRRANGVDGNFEGTVHHLLGDHPVYLELLERYEDLDPLMRLYFGGRYILNSYGGVLNRSGSHAYVHDVHRDIRFAAMGKRFMLNSLVMLDDFTPDNGATHLLPGSHRLVEKPTDAQFRAGCVRATGRRGSMLLFDSRIWHATGHNRTELPRRALTLTFTCPFFKQQFDYPRMMGHDRAGSFTSFLRQVIGYNARVPATLAEYYVPAPSRFYQRGQDDDV